MALSRFGMSADAFTDISPREFYLALKDDAQTKQEQAKIVCETLRMQTWYLVNLELPQHKRIRKPRHLMSFPWDERMVAQTPEEMRRMFRLIAGANKDRHRKTGRKRGPTGQRTGRVILDEEGNMKRITFEEYKQLTNG